MRWFQALPPKVGRSLGHIRGVGEQPPGAAARICVAETGGGITPFSFTNQGIPVSATLIITGRIVGVASARRMSARRLVS